MLAMNHACRPWRTRSRPRGFTLIELMVTLSVVVVLMMVATPSFVGFQRNSQLTSVTNTLLAAINAARAEAMKRGSYAMVVPQDGTNWSSGWTVFVDKDLSQSFDSTKDEVVLQQPAPADYISITGNGGAGGSSPYILYNGSGYSRLTNGSFGAFTLTLARNDVSSTETAAQTRRIVVASTGRTRTCRPVPNPDLCKADATQ